MKAPTLDDAGALDLRRLRAFVVVAEELHFSRAAKLLRVAQPALSQTIKGVEALVGVSLLSRSTRHVELTPAGRAFLTRARAILTTAELALLEARRIDGGLQGTLRVGAIGSASYGLVPSMARRIAEELPDLQLDLTGDLLSPVVARRLAEGTLDIGLLRTADLEPGIASRVLRSEPLLAALPMDHHAAADTTPLPVAHLARERFVSYPLRASAMASAVRAACSAAGFTPDVHHEVRETATLVAFVASGLGVALVPQGVADLRMPGVVYRALAEDVTIDLVVAWSADAPATAIHVVDRLAALAQSKT